MMVRCSSTSPPPPLPAALSIAPSPVVAGATGATRTVGITGVEGMSSPEPIDEVAKRLQSEAFSSAMAQQPKLRQALIAKYGLDLGEQAVAAAMAWAWEHQDRLVGLTGMRAYLFRVAQSSMRRSWVWSKRNSAKFPPEGAAVETGFIDEALDLADLLRKLPQKQRTCVLLVYAHGWPYRDVAELLEISVDAVNNHTHRGMAALRKLTRNADSEDHHDYDHD